jgi:hypothetical protein
MAPRDQFSTFHQAAERAVPHQEQTVSLLPIKRLHRGQSIARRIIVKPRIVRIHWRSFRHWSCRTIF